MQNLKTSMSMVGIVSALACGACEQSADTLAADGLSSELGARREGNARDRGAAGSGNQETSSARTRSRADSDTTEERRNSRRQARRRNRGRGAAAGDAADMPSSGAGGSAAPDASPEPPTVPAQPPEDPDNDDDTPMQEPGGGEVPAPPADPVDPAPEPGPSQMFRPAPGMSWQIQLTGDIDTSVDAEVYDLDLFETSASTIEQLHSAGRKVICYFDTAYESYRPDSKQLEPYRGNPIAGWPGQYWLDIREPAVMEVMNARIALAQSKGCDGVDADDVDARSNNPGFPISASDQRSFVTQLSAAAHARGLAFGLKNALEDLPALLDVTDFAVNEECFVYDECDALRPLIDAGKAVYQIEYANGSLQSRAEEVCARANALGFDTIIKRLDLDAARLSCR